MANVTQTIISLSILVIAADSYGAAALRLLLCPAGQNYESELGSKFPLQHCAGLRVRTFVPARIIDIKDLKAEEQVGTVGRRNP